MSFTTVWIFNKLNVRLSLILEELVFDTKESAALIRLQSTLKFQRSSAAKHEVVEVNA